jgi:asparagine synthase (glutamine-hydrolysing)
VCGIAGFAGDGNPQVLSSLAESLSHRGPDESGLLSGENFGFAFRRMAVLDLNTGSQPMKTTCAENVLVFNGEIYNYRELRSRLEKIGHAFHSESDTETILHAYEEWGISFAERLEGMFAIAIWDPELGQLVMARDRLGKKPLYFATVGNAIHFGSELTQVLLSSKIERKLNRQSLYNFMRTDSTPTISSIYKEVSKVSPATVLTWRIHDGSFTITKYWNPIRTKNDSTFKENLITLEEKIFRAVDERLQADVPLGLFLSSGIDSTVVASVVAAQRGNVHAFNLGFESQSYDESSSAEKIASHLGLTYHQLFLDDTKPEDLLDLMSTHIDEPLNDPATIPQLVLSRETKKFVDVVLTGDGGDELFLSYPNFSAHRLIERNPKFFRAVRPLISNPNFLPKSNGDYFDLGFKAQRFIRGINESDPVRRDIAWRGATSLTDAQLIFSKDFLVDVSLTDPEKISKAIFSELNGTSLWMNFSWMYLRTYLLDTVLVKVDRATMAFGLEARSPLLSHDVVEFCLNLPDDYRIGRHRNKALLKAIASKHVPSEILAAKKHGFGVPTAEWLKGPLLQPLLDYSNEDFLKNQGIFDPSFVRAMISQHKSGKIDRRKELWGFLSFQEWNRKWSKGVK